MKKAQKHFCFLKTLAGRTEFKYPGHLITWFTCVRSRSFQGQTVSV